MTRAELLALAARVEAAEGADRELDAEISVAVHGGEIVWKTSTGTMEAYPTRRYASTGHVGGIGAAPVPAFTASLDAAASLVPEGHEWRVETLNMRDGRGGAIVCRPGSAERFPGVTMHCAATPALALTAAALRAMAEEAGE